MRDSPDNSSSGPSSEPASGPAAGLPPEWDPREPAAQVLMEYLKRASPEFVATELERLGLLSAADAAAEHVLLELGGQARQECRVAAAQFDRRIDAILEQHGVRLADDAAPGAVRWHRCAAAVRRAMPAVALCALLGIVLAVEPRWATRYPELTATQPPAAVRERVYKEYTVIRNPMADGARHGVDVAALRRLGRAMRERGIDAAQLNAGAAVALEYEMLLEPTTGTARFAGLISASVAGKDLQFAAYAAGEGLRAKEVL